jgi:hypothetical protein
MTQNKKISWGGVTSYESPLVKTFAISTEGVLCASLIYDTANYGYEDNNLGDI